MPKRQRANTDRRPHSADHPYDRVRKMLLLLKEKRCHTGQEQQLFLKQLRAELEKNRRATEKLYETVEKGLLPLNEMLTERTHKLETRHKEILTKMARIRRETEMPKDLLSEKNATSSATRSGSVCTIRDRASGNSICGCW